MEPDSVKVYGHGLAVVTVTCSGSPDTGPLLGSLAAATSRPVRTVVADRASTEPTPGADVIALAEDVGRAAALDRAVAALPDTIGWVVIADPAVRWRPGAIDALLAIAFRHPRAGLVGPRLAGPVGPMPSGGALPTVFAAARGRVRAVLPAAGPTGWLSTAAALLRRSAWDSVDGLDPRYLGGAGDMGDVDLGERLGAAGWLVVHEPAAHADVGGGESARDGHGILEPHMAGIRRYVHDRGRLPARALLALTRCG